jgi:hypothetical protein
MQAAEKTNNGIEFLVNLVICQLLKPFSKFVVAVERNKMRCFITIIHKVLETQISGFLKPHVIVERLLNEVIHLALELQELDRELDWVVFVLCVLHNLASLLHDVGVHLVDDVRQS